MKKQILALQIALLTLLICSCSPMQSNETANNNSDVVINNNNNSVTNQNGNTQNFNAGSTFAGNAVPGPAMPNYAVLPDNSTLTINFSASQSVKGNLTFGISSMQLYKIDDLTDEILNHMIDDIDETASNLLLVKFEFTNENIDISSLDKNEFALNCFSLKNYNDELYYANLVYFNQTNLERPASEFFYYEIPSIGTKDSFILGWLLNDNDMEFLSNNNALISSYYHSIHGNYNSFKINFEDIIIN